MSKNSSKVSNKNKQEMFFWSKLDQNEFWGRNFANLTPHLESVLPKYHVCQFLCKTDSFDFFSANLPINEFWGQNFKNLSPDPESATPGYHECQFSVKMVNFEFFGPNFGPITCDILVPIMMRML